MRILYCCFLNFCIFRNRIVGGRSPVAAGFDVRSRPDQIANAEWITSASGPDEIKRMMLNCTQVNSDWLGPSVLSQGVAGAQKFRLAATMNLGRQRQQTAHRAFASSTLSPRGGVPQDKSAASCLTSSGTRMHGRVRVCP